MYPSLPPSPRWPVRSCVRVGATSPAFFLRRTFERQRQRGQHRSHRGILYFEHLALWTGHISGDGEKSHLQLAATVLDGGVCAQRRNRRSNVLLLGNWGPQDKGRTQALKLLRGWGLGSTLRCDARDRSDRNGVGTGSHRSPSKGP